MSCLSLQSDGSGFYGPAEFTVQKHNKWTNHSKCVRKLRKRSEAFGTGPPELCCNYPDSLCFGIGALSAEPALSLGFIFHALRSRTNWVSVSVCWVAHYPRERLKCILSQVMLRNTTKGWMSVHCTHCLVKIPDTRKGLTSHRHDDLSPTYPGFSLSLFNG